MSAITAIYEDGVFRPVGPVALPDRCEVELEVHVRRPQSASGSMPEGGNLNDVQGVAGSIEEKLALLAAGVPAAEWDRPPDDLSDQLDHYDYRRRDDGVGSCDGRFD